MMHATARLLLPFDERIDKLAIDYAVLTAQRLCATLIPLALIYVRPGKRARAEHLQQAQDFLVLVRTRARRQGVEIEPVQLYTSDPVRSIEAFASEMHCEMVLLFLKGRGASLLRRGEIQALMTRLACNMQIMLLPLKQIRRTGRPPMYAPLAQGAYQEEFASRKQRQQPAAFIQRLLSSVLSHG